MKILVFSELLYPHGGGAELATWLYTKMLAEEGFDLSIVTGKFPNEQPFEIMDNRVKVYRFPVRAFFGTRYYTLANIGILMSSLMAKLIKRSDIVYIPGGWYSAIPFAKAHRKPVIVHLHNYSIVCPTSLMYDFAKNRVGSSLSVKSFLLHEIIEKRRATPFAIGSTLLNELFGKHYSKLAMLADALIFVSKSQANLVLSIIPHIKERSYIIYNPIPDLPFVRAERKGIGFFGGRSFAKGFHILIKVLKSLKENDITLYTTMTAKSNVSIKLNNIKVNFLPKVKPIVLMKKISATAFLSICPEPSPYTVIESFLHGKLVIASNIGGVSELTSGFKDGVLLVNPWNYEEVQAALKVVASLSLEEVNEIGAKNRELILHKFNNKDTIKKFIGVLDKVAQ